MPMRQVYADLEQLHCSVREWDKHILLQRKAVVRLRKRGRSYPLDAAEELLRIMEAIQTSGHTFLQVAIELAQQRRHKG